MEIDLDTIEQTDRTRWLDCGGVRFLIRYASPKEAEKFRRSVIARGIARMNRGDFEVNQGRERDWFLALATQYVLGWDGEGIKASDPEKAKYTPEKMAIVMENRSDVLRLVSESISEAEAFFTGNGGTQTTS